MELRPYQVEAVERIAERQSMLLAMTMGSGKTATSIAAIRRLRRERVVTSGVVFALKSTLYQWEAEIHRWDPRARVQVIEGTGKQKAAALLNSSRFHYNITNYETAVNQWEDVRTYLPIDFIICDEATYIKSFGAKRSKAIKKLGKQTPVRLALSGQPVENRPEEAYSIMEFVDAEVLGPFHRFDRAFIKRDHWGKPRSYHNLPLFHERMAPAMFRKSRKDIEAYLPERIPVEMPVHFSEAYMALHHLIKTDLSDAIDNALGGGSDFDVMEHYGRVQHGQAPSAMGKVMSRMLAMRMLSSHVDLLKLSADDFDSPVSKAGSEYASVLRAEGVLDGLPSSNPKLDALMEYVDEIMDSDPDHKVVIFSFFKPMLRIIGEAMKKRHYPFVLIDGTVTGKHRNERIHRFNDEPKMRVLLSSDAGAYGVDLPSGSHLVCYDLPWSAGALAQRVARIDRTSSKFKSIHIAYMYGVGTIEERMFRMLQQKAAVAAAFIDGEFDQSGKLNLNLETLREFLDES